MKTSTAVFQYLNATCRGSGQVVFMNNPITGLLNVAAFLWAAYFGGTTIFVALGAILGTFVSTITAYPLHADRESIRSGLYGFNGMLVGAALPTFLDNTPSMWALLLLATITVTFVTIALERLLSPWKIPGLTFPFVLTSWIVLLATYRFTTAAPAGLPKAQLIAPAVAVDHVWTLGDFLHASLTSVSQVFFVNNPVSGAIFLFALAVHSRWCALLAASGAALAVVTAWLLGADPTLILHGLWGYSAALTAPAIGCIFLKPSARSLALSALAVGFTVLVQAATASVSETVGLPALTFPFVLTTWIFLLAKPGVESESAEPNA